VDGPDSMLINSYAQAHCDSEKSVEQEIPSGSKASVVLALQVTSVKFLHLEI
jgi:hypothetical protein